MPDSSRRRSVVWFRRDLRIHDHPALLAAVADGDVLPLFVLDPAFERAGGPRRALLHDALVALDRAIGGALVVRHGDPVDELPSIAAEVGATTVYVSRDFGPYGRRRDEVVADALLASGSRLRGVGSPYAVAPGGVTKDDGSSYAVFTPFAKRWRVAGWEPPHAAPTDPTWIEARSDGLPARPEWAVVPDPSPRAVDEQWRRFRADGLDSYDAGRDVPALDATSRLSPLLKFGVLHPRRLLADLDVADASHAAFSNELAWRDFYADVLSRRPDSAWSNLDARFDRLAVDTDAGARARFERWCSGTTGFPIVDAGMRQLLQTGWMHNRVRMIVASFLVKDLHVPWQWGARFFLQHLLDGDLASNNHGWQWAAGSGTDAAPFFRVFNPTTQQERWDPDGDYVARWIAEYGTSAYPAAMLDHAAERREALDRYEAVKRT